MPPHPSPSSPHDPGSSERGSADETGRHRRPESLADVRVLSGPRVAMVGASQPRRSTARHQRPGRAGRHAAAPRPPAKRPPATGAHRAPGTLPIESWLLMGKTRQQALLASLVAIGVLLLAVPAEQRRDSIDAVNAAAQAVAGVQTSAAEKKPAKPRTEPEQREATRQPDQAQQKQQQPSTPKKPAPAPTSAAPGAAPTAQPEPTEDTSDLGPGKSLRTTGSDLVALTFDDGPDPVQTPRILRLLDKYEVKAVFCVVGTQAQRHPDLLRQIVAAGHTLCNHTWDHSLTIGKDEPEKIAADLARTNAAIRTAVPDAEIPFFRAPGGNFTERLVTVAGQDAMTSLYWEVDPRDWDHPEKETAEQHVARVVGDVQKNVRPGAIVLSHDFNQPDTVAAYEKLLPWLVDNFALGIPRQAVEPAPVPSSAAPSPEVSGPADR
ncbi:polysaccharide deacetylase family protein [Actinoplanes sp. URMC 104]|uniref:polysaccharide deacetylase family protein n=1 Tax=Actinoplanes sp. URMC 104 TaxID=3423409 RepID=UPI003F1DE8D5